MFSLKKRLEPVLAEAQDTMEVARAGFATVVLLSAVAVAVSLLTLLAVRELSDHVHRV